MEQGVRHRLAYGRLGWASVGERPCRRDGRQVRIHDQSHRIVYLLRERLYELEEQLDRGKFVRISNGEIINLDKVTAVDLSLTGTIRMTLGEAGYAYVSRRCC